MRFNMSRWAGPIDFEKYYGKRKYKEIQSRIKKIEYSKNEKQKIVFKNIFVLVAVILVPKHHIP